MAWSMPSWRNGQSRVGFDIYPDLGYNGRWLMAGGLQPQLAANFLLYQRGEIEDETDDGR